MTSTLFGAIRIYFEVADTILLAIPSQTLRENLDSWKSFFPRDLPVISTLKGIEVQTQFTKDVYGQIDYMNLGKKEGVSAKGITLSIGTRF